MICPKCGAENREEALFCGDCGHRIQRLTPKQKWILIGVLSIFTIIFLGIKISNHINFTNSLEQGESALKSGKFQEALDFCKKAVDLKPENEKAKTCLKDATENLINSFISAGKEFMSAGKYEQASDLFQKALNLGGGAEVKKLLDIAKAKIEAEAKAKARAEAINRAINGPYKKMDWDNAVKYCKELGLRLPTEYELINMYNSECSGREKGLGCGDNWFWSSEDWGTFFVVVVNFSNGYVSNNFKSSNLCYVRCVR